MGQTQHFGFYTFGSEGRISDLGHKFTIQDREIMDQLLYMLYSHDHSIHESIPGPANRPSIELGDTPGSLPAATDLYYQVSFLDVYGNETYASAVASIRTPGTLPNPPTPGTATAATDGALPPGTYRYAIAWRQGPYTTMAPNVAVINVPPGTTTNTITLTVGAIAEGADSYDVYRRGPGDPTFYLIANATSTAFVDNGTYPPDCTKTRPARNDTNSFNSVLISLDELDTPLAPGIASWRIYRSTSPSFGSNSLLVTVTETATEQGGALVTEYLDIGGGTVRGTPLLQSSIPPQVPQLDASKAFDLNGGPLPANLAPRGTSAFTTMYPGEVAAGVFDMISPMEDMHVRKVEAFFQTAPAGTDDDNYYTLVLSDNHTANAIQAIWHDATPQNTFMRFDLNGATGGTFTLTYDGQTTDPLPWDATALQVQDALNDLSNIEQVFVVGDGFSSAFTIEFIDPGGMENPLMSADSSLLENKTILMQYEILGTDGGSFLLYDGTEYTDPISASDTAGDLKTKLEMLGSITEVNVTGQGSNEDPWIVHWVSPAAVDVPLLLPYSAGLNGLVYVEEVQEGAGPTSVELVFDEDVQRFVWVGSNTLSGQVEAEVTDFNGSIQEDLMAGNSYAVRLAGGSQGLTWDAGVLDAGSYEFTWRIRPTDEAGAISLRVNGADPDESPEPVLTELASILVPAQGFTYVTYHVRVVLPAPTLIQLEADMNSGEFNVDRLGYQVRLPKFSAGTDCSIELTEEGASTPGENLHVTVWY